MRQRGAPIVRICHLSWEFPPVVYGGLGRHVYAIAREQARAGHEVVVLSHVGIDVDDGRAAPIDEVIEGVRVIRVVRDAPFVPFEPDTLLGWVGGLASAMTRRGLSLGREWTPEVVHAHDWLTAHAASTIVDALGVPWVHTVHATEAGRHQGWLPNALSRSIHSIEHWAAHAADRLLVCSRHMRWEVQRLFDMSDARVVPNGVDASVGLMDASLRDGFRREFPGPLLVHTGRLEWEKGAHTLIEALPRIRRAVPDVRCVIAGRGSQADSLRQLAKRKRVASRVHLTGWLPEPNLRALVAAADIAVVPSIYEPFGIVALEAASLGTPVVAARSGGLVEFLDEDRHGWGFEAGDVAGLAEASIACLSDPQDSAARAASARRHVLAHHGWAAIAELTAAEYRATRRKTVKRDVAVLPGEGNLLFDAH